MCGRYTLHHPLKRVVEAFDVARTMFDDDAWKARYNIAPSQNIPIVRVAKDGERELAMLRWGLIPSWAKEKPKLQPINARSETVATSGMFKRAFASRRCLIPADGFYEWKKLDAKTKQPMHIRLKHGDLYAFAGLWERWRPDPEAEPVDTVTMLTTTPNELMKSIHDRMPVILPTDAYTRWLDPDNAGDDVADLLQPYRPDAMEDWPVSTHVNSPRNEDADCVKPAA